MEKFAREREQTPDRAERTDTLVWGKNAVTELLKSGGAVDTVYLTADKAHPFPSQKNPLHPTASFAI